MSPCGRDDGTPRPDPPDAVAQGETYAGRREVRFGERIEAATIQGLAVETDGIA
jgi:hypothetical protein